MKFYIIVMPLTPRPKNKILSEIFLVCFIYQSVSMWLKVGENVVQVSNSLDLDETPSYSASHPDLTVCIGTSVVLGGLRVKEYLQISQCKIL